RACRLATFAAGTGLPAVAPGQGWGCASCASVDLAGSRRDAVGPVVSRPRPGTSLALGRGELARRFPRSHATDNPPAGPPRRGAGRFPRGGRAGQAPPARARGTRQRRALAPARAAHAVGSRALEVAAQGSAAVAPGVAGQLR